MNDIVHTATHLSWPALVLGFVALLFVAYHAVSFSCYLQPQCRFHTITDNH